MAAGTVTDDQYYRCFICETDQNSLEEFELHLQCLGHLSNLLSRRMIASEHYNLLVQLNNFSLLKENHSKDETLSSATSSSPSSGISLDDDSPVCKKTGCSTSSKSPQDLRRNIDRDLDAAGSGVPTESTLENESVASPKPVVGNFYCNLCSVSLPDCKAVAQHGKGAKHRSNKDAYPLKSFSIFKCNICGLGLDTSQNATHHFQSTHGAKQNNSSQGSGKKKRSPFAVLVCQPCGKMGATVGNMKQHFKSEAHVETLKDRGGKTNPSLLQCRPCKNFFTSLAELKEHVKLPETSKKSQFLNSTMFL